MSESTELRIRVSEGADADVAHDLADHDDRLTVQETAPGGGGLTTDVEPITAILVGGAVLAVGKFVADWWERRKGGLMIDLRPGAECEVSRSADVPAGYVLVFPAEGGKVEIKTIAQPEDAIERLLSQIISGVFTSVEQLTDLASEVLEGDPEVTTEPAETPV